MIHRHVGQYAVRKMCRWLSVSASGYYAWRARHESARAREDRRLVVEIRALHESTRRSYGSPRIVAELRGRGWRVGRHRVARLMRREGLRAKPRRRFRVTTRSDHNHPVAIDRVRRRFTAPAPNRLWVSDITYVWTREGWLYLAIILGLFSRRVVGWSMGSRLTSALAVDALRMAVGRRRPSTGLVVHSDRGVQYASAEFRKTLLACGAIQSMSRKGNCYDNAVAESFFGSLKIEWIPDRWYETRTEARRDIVEYIEAFYNCRRLHSTLGRLSPQAFERQAAGA